MGHFPITNGRDFQLHLQLCFRRNSQSPVDVLPTALCAAGPAEGEHEMRHSEMPAQCTAAG